MTKKTNFKPELNLELAGILFVNAFTNISDGKLKYNKLEQEINAYNKCYKKGLERYQIDSTEFISFMVPELRSLEIYYEPVVRFFTTAKILLVCSAEIFINEVSRTVLKGRSFDEFDKLSIIGKWIFIQKIVNVKKVMTVDCNPLQGFSKLVKERNKLIHFKGIPRDLNSFEIPSYISDLKLTPKDCIDNFCNVKSLIRDFCINWTGSSGPDWLNVDEKEDYRNPCFYLFNRQSTMVLYSEEHDQNKF